MQNSGMCPPLSDGAKKTVVGSVAPKVAKAAVKVAAVKAPAPSAHRRGGFAKHAKGGK